MDHASGDASKSHSNQHVHDTFRWEYFTVRGVHRDYLEGMFSKSKVAISEEYIARLKESAKNGVSESQYELAECYRKGAGIPSLPLMAFHYYRLAANQGHPGAQVELGLCFEHGKCVTQSFEKAFFYYKLAADQGSQLAINHLGRCFERGIGVQQDLKQAFYYYQRSVDGVSLCGLDDIARCYQEGIGVEKSAEKAAIYNQKFFTKMKIGADAGDRQKQVFVGRCFEKGSCVSQSIEHAVYYYKLAAEQDDESAFRALACCYAEGRGVSKSIDVAIEYYQKAIEAGNVTAHLELARLLLDVNRESQACSLLKWVAQSSCELDERADSQYLLGCCYEKGKGVERSVKNALYYYELAANGGDVDALYRLGKAYCSGELDLVQSFEKCLFYFRAAADKDDLGSLRILAKVYEQGLGIEKSPEQAELFWEKLFAGYERYTKEGFSWAQAELGYLHEHGKGVARSIQKAVQYYNLAAQQNDPMGQYYLGKCYEDGNGVNVSFEKACFYYKLAADQGLECAEAAFKQLSEHISNQGDITKKFPDSDGHETASTNN